MSPKAQKRGAAGGREDDHSSKKTARSQPSHIRCARCLAEPLPGATNWHAKQIHGDKALPLDNKCRSCWCLWHRAFRSMGTFDEWVAACKTAEGSAKAGRALAKLPAEDQSFLEGSLTFDDTQHLCVQRHLIGMSHKQFRAKYAANPEDVNVKVQSLPGLKPGTTYRGVLMEDPTCPGLRYVYSRSEGLSCHRYFEQEAPPSVVANAFFKEAADDKNKDAIRTKMRTCSLTHAEIIDSLRHAGMEVTPVIASWAGLEGSSGQAEGGACDLRDDEAVESDEATERPEGGRGRSPSRSPAASALHPNTPRQASPSEHRYPVSRKWSSRALGGLRDPSPSSSVRGGSYKGLKNASEDSCGTRESECNCSALLL